MSLLTLSNNNISMIMKFKYYINDYEVIQRWRCFWPSGGIAICITLQVDKIPVFIRTQMAVE